MHLSPSRHGTPYRQPCQTNHRPPNTQSHPEPPTNAQQPHRVDFFTFLQAFTLAILRDLTFRGVIPNSCRNFVTSKPLPPKHNLRIHRQEKRKPNNRQPDSGMGLTSISSAPDGSRHNIITQIWQIQRNRQFSENTASQWRTTDLSECTKRTATPRALCAK